MKHAVKAILLITLIVLIELPREVDAQWQKVSGPLFRLASGGVEAGGAISYSNGTVWAGAIGICTSEDRGLTWTSTAFPSAGIGAINALNDSIALGSIYSYSSSLKGTFITTDQGTTWNQVWEYGEISMVFGGSPDTIICSLGFGDIYRTTDRGKSWAQQYLEGSNYSGIPAKGPIVYRRGVNYLMDQTWLATSSDGGETWNHVSMDSTANSFCYDCYSMALDSCDDNSAYLAAENVYFKISRPSIIVTSDKGASWRTRNPQSGGMFGGFNNYYMYYTGNIATARSCIYVQTIEGILRSEDHGTSWQNIGGPPGWPDNALLAVVEDSVLLVADTAGNMWRTGNDGGVPLANPNLQLHLPDDTLFKHASVRACETAFAGVSVATSCSSPVLQSAKIIGADSTFYQVTSTTRGASAGIDSVALHFSPGSPRSYTATLVLNYDHDVTLKVPLGGHAARGISILQASTNAIDAGKTYVCEERDTSVVIQNSGCDTLCVSGISVTPSGFVLASGTPTVFCLGPGDKDTVHFQTVIDTAGRPANNTAILQVTSNADRPLVPIALSRDISYPVNWSLVMSGADSAYAGSEVIYRIIQRGTLPADISTVSCRLAYSADLLELLSVDQPNVTISNIWPTGAGDQHETIRIAPSYSDSVMATLHFRCYVAASLSSAIILDSVVVASTLGRSQDCIASVTSAGSEFSIRSECATDLLTSFLLDQTIQITGIRPNPASGEITMSYSLAGTSPVTGDISIEDALGREVQRTNVTLTPGANQSQVLSLDGLPSGVYLLRASDGRLSTTRRIVKE